MDGDRTNIFDYFNGGSNLVYTELQPIQAPSPFQDGPEYDQQQTSYNLNAGVATDETLVHSGENDDSSFLDFEPSDEHLDTFDSPDVNWMPDDDILDEPENVFSSDESSDEEDNPDVLFESDIELQGDLEEDDELNAEEAISLPETSNLAIGKNGMIWSEQPCPQVGRTPTRNVFRPPKCHTRNSKRVDSVSSAFTLILTEGNIRLLVTMTNLEGVRSKGENWKPVDYTEMKALIGLYIHLGARKLSLLGVRKIWYGASADSVALCTMSMKRFVELSTNLRFDDKATRSARREKDVFAPLRHLFSEVNKNLQREYSPSQNLTVDEQLVPWRGRAKFIQFLPSKPDKYGLKLFMICDSETAYPLQAIPYLGKHGERKKNLGREIVKELAAPYHKTGRNVTSDNFFTDMELAEHLSKNGLSLVGTVRKNKAFLPSSFQKGTDIKKFDSKFLFKEGVGMVAYKSNDKKHVVVMSTMHHAPDVDHDGKKKPEMIKFYNRTKGGVDTFDYMCHSFSTKRKTRRWPMVLFYNLLDTAAVSSHIIYKDVFPKDTASHRDRGLFNELLAKELVSEHLQRRMKKSRTTKRIRLAFEILKLEWNLKEDQTVQCERQRKRKVEQSRSKSGDEGTSNGKRQKSLQQGRCVRCPRKSDRKVRQVCSKCHQFVCKEHSGSSVVCFVCGFE